MSSILSNPRTGDQPGRRPTLPSGGPTATVALQNLVRTTCHHKAKIIKTAKRPHRVEHHLPFAIQTTNFGAIQ